MALERLLAFAIALTLAGAVPLSVVAARGFWHAPFGAVLLPLPVAFVGFLARVTPVAVGLDVPPAYTAGTATVGVLAAFLAAVQGVVLLAGWREV